MVGVSFSNSTQSSFPWPCTSTSQAPSHSQSEASTMPLDSQSFSLTVATTSHVSESKSYRQILELTRGPGGTVHAPGGRIGHDLRRAGVDHVHDARVRAVVVEVLQSYELEHIVRVRPVLQCLLGPLGRGPLRDLSGDPALHQRRRWLPRRSCRCSG